MMPQKMILDINRISYSEMGIILPVLHFIAEEYLGCYTIYIYIYQMSWCCGPGKTLKKKTLPPAYLKKKPVTASSQRQNKFGYPLPTGSTRIAENGDIRKTTHELNLSKGQLLQKGEDFSVVEQQQDPTNRFVLKKIQKCDYDEAEMAMKFRGTSQKWTDPDFNYEDLTVKGEKVQWKRPEQFIANPDLFPEEITPNDVYQGWLNDCYYLSAVSCLAEKPHRIYSIFSSMEYNPNGYYICKLTFNGVYQEVIVDDLFPVIGSATPVYAKPPSAKYIWVMVLQKCWAKLLKGYTNTNDGYTSEAFYALTGAPTKFYLLGSFLTASDSKYMALFNRLRESDEKGFVTEVSIGPQSPQEKRLYEDKYGLTTSHAYSLLGVFQTKLINNNTVKLLQIRNPIGASESKLLWNDQDPRWKLVLPSQKQRMLFSLNKNSSDGVFYMDWQTFVGKFNYLFSICEINDLAHYLYTQLDVLQGEVKYLEVQSDGSPEDLGISFVQEMQEHFKEDVQYANVSVIASRIGESNSQQKYQFIGAGNYYSQEIENYYFFPVKKFPKGRYLFRIYVSWPDTNKKSTRLVVGLYSSAVIGLREVKGIDEQQFLQLNCLSVARSSPERYSVYSDKESWYCLGYLPGTNMGFYVLNYGLKSAANGYRIVFNERTNSNLYFMFEYEGKKVFEIPCEKGYQYVVLFAFVMDASAVYKRTFYPEEVVWQRMPRPDIKMI